MSDSCKPIDIYSHEDMFHMCKWYDYQYTDVQGSGGLVKVG